MSEPTKINIQYSGMYTKYTRLELLQKVHSKLSDKRFAHVLRVEQMALQLAEKYHVELEKTSIAALIHDYAKERPDEEMRKIILKEQMKPELLEYGNPIWHSILGAYLASRELDIRDSSILQAVSLHTTGAAKMSSLDKIIYVADFIETGRTIEAASVGRKIAFTDLDEAVAYETKQTLQFLIQQNYKIYPKTIETYNQWVPQKLGGNYHR